MNHARIRRVFFVDSIKTSGPSGTDTPTRVPPTSSTRRKSLLVRLVKHTLGNERALRIAVLLVLEVRFAACLAEQLRTRLRKAYIK